MSPEDPRPAKLAFLVSLFYTALIVIMLWNGLRREGLAGAPRRGRRPAGGPQQAIAAILATAAVRRLRKV